MEACTRSAPPGAHVACKLIHHRRKAGGVSDPRGAHTFPE